MQAITTLDSNILNAMMQHFHTDALTVLMRIFSLLGEYGAVWIILAGVLMLRRSTRTAGILTLLALLIATIIGEFGIKLLVQRARPFVQFPEMFTALTVTPPHGFSFPSSHTLSSFASAGALCVLHKRVGIPALVLAACIGVSRLYLCVHYPSDVAAGLVLGLAVGVAVALISKRVLENHHYARLR